MKNNNYKQTEIGKIPEDWKIAQLFELMNNITDGKHGDCTNQENSGYYFISCKDINEGKINYFGARQITEKDFDETNKRTRLEQGDVLLTNSGTIGRLAIATDLELTKRTTFQKSVAILKPKKEKIISNFLYYQLLFRRNRLVETSGGTTQKNLLLKDIRNFTISLPSLFEQRQIVSVLSSIDDKIELNRQIIKTLEEIGKTLFRRWFVDFEFPNNDGKPYKSSGGKMVDSELGEIPEGWEVKSLDAIATFLNGVACQKYPPKDEFGLPVIKIGELHNGITENSDRASSSITSEYIIKDGDVLFSWSGSLEIVVWTRGKGVLNQHLFKVSSEIYPKWFYYQWVLRYLPFFREIASNKVTTMGHIQRRHLTESYVLVPPTETLRKMEIVMTPLLDKIVANSIEVNFLSKARDSLLPRLMSGRIRV